MHTKLLTKTILIILFSIILLNSCNAQVKKENEMKANGCVIVNDLSYEGKETFFKKITEERDKYYSEGNSVEYSKQYTYDIIPDLFPILSQWMNGKNYKPVSQEKFDKVLQNVFQINLSKKSDRINISKDYWEYGPKGISHDSDGNLIDDGAFIFSSQYKLLFRPIFNGVLIEEIDRTGRYKSCFNENIYHYNNFLFHDSNASLTWLIGNDVEFLDNLVRDCGFGQNDKLNQKVIKKNYELYHQVYDRKKYHSQQIEAKRARVIENLFAAKNCYGELNIREGLMQSIVNMTTFEDNKYLLWMTDDFTSFLGGVIRGSYTDGTELFSSFTMEEKVKILAYTCYYIEQAYIKNGVDYANHAAEPLWIRRSPLNMELKSTPQLLDHLKKHNYYGLPNYQKLVEDHLRLADELGWG